MNAKEARSITDSHPHLDKIYASIKESATMGYSSIFYNVSSMNEISLGLLISQLRYDKFNVSLMEAKTMLLISW